LSEIFLSEKETKLAKTTNFVFLETLFANPEKNKRVEQKRRQWGRGEERERERET
jgi:hypothetical protein